MDRKEAEAKALELWPNRTCYTGWLDHEPGGLYRVGELIGGCEVCGPSDFFEAGCGESWEAAFEDAARRVRREKEREERLRARTLKGGIVSDHVVAEIRAWATRAVEGGTSLATIPNPGVLEAIAKGSVEEVTIAGDSHVQEAVLHRGPWRVKVSERFPGLTINYNFKGGEGG